MTVLGDAAPSWVTYMTLGIAAIGLVTGVGSLGVAYATFRAAGPRVTVAGPGILVASSSSKSNKVWTGGLTVRNRGQSPVNLDEVLLQAIGKDSRSVLGGFEFGLAITHRIVDPEESGLRLEGSQSQTWTLNLSASVEDVASVLEDTHEGLDPVIRLGVLLGNGEWVWSTQSFEGNKVMTVDVLEELSWRQDYSTSADSNPEPGTEPR
jgi:hypothetical protein